jgi:hypothetical protein
MIRCAADPAERTEFETAWRAAGVTCIFQNAGEEWQDPLRLLVRLARFTFVTDSLARTGPRGPAHRGPVRRELRLRVHQLHQLAHAGDAPAARSQPEARLRAALRHRREAGSGRGRSEGALPSEQRTGSVSSEMLSYTTAFSGSTRGGPPGRTPTSSGGKFFLVKSIPIRVSSAFRRS